MLDLNLADYKTSLNQRVSDPRAEIEQYLVKIKTLENELSLLKQFNSNESYH